MELPGETGEAEQPQMGTQGSWVPISVADTLAVGALFLNTVIGAVRLVSPGMSPVAVVIDIAWTAGFVVVIYGLATTRDWGRSTGIVVTGAAYAIGLVTSGAFLSTTLLALVLLVIAALDARARRHTRSQI